MLYMFFAHVIKRAWLLNQERNTWVTRSGRMSWRIFFANFDPKYLGRSWAIAVRRGAYESLFLLNSGHFALKNIGGKFSSEL